MVDEHELNDHEDDPVNDIMEETICLPTTSMTTVIHSRRTGYRWFGLKSATIHPPTRPSTQRTGWLWMPVPCALNEPI